MDFESSDEEVAQRVFLSGVSTATDVSHISGRGVGLDAVRSFVRRQGGEVKIAFTGTSRDGCRPFELALHLPVEAAWSDHRRTESMRVAAVPSQA
jgi:chemotaxis protein histidine kinase CheA